MSDDLKRRLSLIMPVGSIKLYSLEGTELVDMKGLAVNGKTLKVNGYDQISSADFMPVKTVAVEGNNLVLDLVEYYSERKLGRISYNGSWYFSELCTGSAEELCSLQFDSTKQEFQIDFRNNEGFAP